MNSEATEDYSKAPSALGAVSLAVLALSALGAVLLVAAELTTVVQVKVGTEVVNAQKGHDRHSWALALLGLAALPMAYGAALRRARPALFALALIGVIALVVALALDLPDLDETGIFGADFEDAKASGGPGFTLEVLGGLVLVAAGAVGLALSGGRSPG